MTSRWNYLPLTTEEQKLETDLAKVFAKCPPISELLVQRGITSVEEAEKFFHPSLKDMHDPFLMPDMDKAVDRLNQAMGLKEKIMVFGDYDVVYMSETPITEVRKILFNNQADFMIRNLLRKAFIPKSMFQAIFSALKIVREIRFDCARTNKKFFKHKVIERILSHIKDNEELSPDDIKYLVSKIN